MSLFAPLDLLLTLAQEPQGLTREKQAEILYWSVVLVVVATVMGIVGFLIYRKIKRVNETPAGEQAGFSLSEVRRLYEAGEVSHEEFVQVKERILAAARKSMAGDASMSQVSSSVAAPPTSPLAGPPPVPPLNLSADGAPPIPSEPANSPDDVNNSESGESDDSLENGDGDGEKNAPP